MVDRKPKKASAERRTFKLPPGYDDEAAFLAEARERFTEGHDADRENREEGVEDLEFFAGKQWDDEAKVSRAGRPCLTINTLPPIVAQVVGDIRINRPAIKVRPAEDADKDLADVREGLIRSIERQSKAHDVYVNAGQSQVVSGIGNFRVAIRYAANDVFDRDIRIERIPNPFAVVWDPLSVEPTGADADWCFVNDEVPRKAFEKAHPEAKETELLVTATSDGWVTRDTVRVTEYWLMVERPAIYALLEGGKVVEVKEEAGGYVEVLRKGAMESSQPLSGAIQTNEATGDLIVRKSVRRSACMYLITGHAILGGPYELPIERVPILRVMGWEANVGDKRVRWGLVRFAKDSVRLKNYWRSVAAETIALAPKGKWLASETAVPEDREEDFRTAAKSDDPLLLYTGNQPPQYTRPPDIPAALLQEAALNAQDIKDTTGLHDASLGARSNETSGKAILARERQGDVATYIYHDNLKSAIGAAGQIVEQLIPIVYDTARTIRILGDDESTKVLRINDPNDKDSVDITRGKYDVVVETGPSYSTKRVEAAESMTAFLQAYPAAAAVAGDLIAKAQDWPDAERMAERLKKTIPPQILAGEDGEEPKAPDPAQQQAMQLQQQAATLDLRTKEAQAKKAEAEALEAGYDAQIKQLDLAARQGQAIAYDDDPAPAPMAPGQMPAMPEQADMFPPMEPEFAPQPQAPFPAPEPTFGDNQF